MTDSMKFGPEWLRNMSAEPSPATNSSNNGAGGGGIGLGSGAGVVSGGNGSGTNSSFGPHSITNTIGSGSRNMFPEYRYGREEMLSLFDRNCLLPQILPSFKKLFVEKVQYPLALTPSSEEELNSQISLGSGSRPAWLQRSTGGFGTTSRGTGRGGTVDRGRMRGKSIYHPIFQRSAGIYDEGGLSSISMKPDRNWSERNGTGDSVAIGASAGGPIGTGGIGMEWNGTPSSSPRKEFSSHHRNMENWRRSRNEDGSGDGPSATGNGGVVASGLSGADVAGWRSSGGGSIGTNNASFASNSHRWGRSTSWRDEELNIDGSAGNMQRSISTIGTVNSDRERVVGGGVGKLSGSGTGGSGAGVSNDSTRQIVVSKGNQSWTGCGSGGPDTDDNLPEWAMENPSELGGTFDASGAFHGDSDKPERGNNAGSTDIKAGQVVPHTDQKEKLIKSSVDSSNEHYHGSDEETDAAIREPTSAKIEEASGTGSGDLAKPPSVISEVHVEGSTSVSPTESIVHGDISERFKEVADEVEKLIMEDDNSTVSQSQMRGLSEIEMNMRQNPQVAIPGPTAPNQHHQQHQLPFSDQLTIQQHHHHLQQQHLAMLTPTPHMMNANINDLWFYRDPQANVQGPFSAMEMTEWYRAGYFNENLFVRRFSDSRFRPLGELIKLCHGSMPFTNSHLLPSRLDLDNMQLPALATAVPVPIPVRSSEEQQLQLKANVTAAADSLSAAVKGVHHGGGSAGHAMDNTTSHMLTMRFQMLQDQYLQHQEYQILAELSKNECFQRLSAIEREAVVRRKVQMLVLPEYLSSLSGLSNSLSVLNPIAGSQLYDVIAEQAKKDQQLPPVGNLLEANDFILNAQLMHQQAQAQVQSQPQVQQPTASEPDKLNDLPGGSELDLLNEFNLRMLLRGQSSGGQQHQPPTAPVTANSSSDFIAESQLLAAQNLVMPMWLPPAHTQTQPQPSHQWPGMPNTKVTLWDVATLEEQTQQQQQLIQQHNLPQGNSAPPLSSSVEISDQIQASDNQGDQDAVQDSKQGNGDLEQCSNQQSTAGSGFNVKSNNKQLQSTFQTSKSQQSQQPQQPQQPMLKVTEEERRREHVEEKRRLKEERKRQQIEDEKRRAHQVEEERSREIQEERERQQQIQAQRRKALLGNSAPVASPIPVSGTLTTNKQQGSSKPGVGFDRDRAPASSIAPWSLQPHNVNNAAPGLAEIQKAERRERRADQQRQQEQLDKQMRASAAAAAEANDALLKWQAAPALAPVMSLADIQAEEAKRLANELLEQQRRRDIEQQQATVSANVGVGSSFSNIWGNSNKAWTSSGPGKVILTADTSMVGLWDENKHGASSNFTGGVVGPTTAAAVLAAGLQPSNKSQSKLAGAALPTPRNLRKSQTLPAMHNANSLGKNGKSSVAQVQEKNKVVQGKPGVKITSAGTEDNKDKKNSAKGHQQGNDFENEFTGWCTKSLENMSAKVDVPTFVAFLQDLEAPYEVKDYVRIYLGDGKESTDFAKQFLERRSKYKNLQRAQFAHNDDMCKPAPAITPSSNDNTDNKNKQKKIKKNKMTKMDARILGFSVTAAEGRINVGVRDFVDGP